MDTRNRRGVTVNPMQQFQRGVKPVLEVQKNDQCKVTDNGHRTEVIMPVVHGHGMSIAQCLVVRHPEGDVTVLEAFTPEGMKAGAACGVATELREQSWLYRGDHYERISVYKMWTGVSFQRWGYKGLNERVGMVSHSFPDIRRCSPANLEKLSRFTGMRFAVNMQLRWKEYMKIEDTRFARHNTGARALGVFNQADLSLMDQTINQVADVAWGTELHVARELMAMQLASEGPLVKIVADSPTFGFAPDVSESVRFETPAVKVVESVRFEAPAAVEAMEVSHVA
jgi:hypothetical protein